MNRIEALYLIKQNLPPNPVTCEIGFFKGEYSKAIREILQPKTHYVIDTFSDLNHISGDKDGENLQSQNMVEMEDLAKSLGYIVLKGTSDRIHEVDEFIDFIYIDADHSYEWVKKDLYNCSKVISNSGSGILAGHDYHPSRFYGCWAAVNEFCGKNQLLIDFVTNDGCPSYFINIPRYWRNTA